MIFNKNIDDKIRRLNAKQQLVFGLLCSARLIPCLSLVSDDKGSVLEGVQAALEYASRVISNQDSLDKPRVEKEVARFLLALPEFNGLPQTSDLQASHALTSTVYTLEGLLDGEFENTVYVSHMALESVYLLIQSLNPGCELEQIKKHQLYKQEILKQNVDIEVLKTMVVFAPEFLTSMMQNNLSCQIDAIDAKK